MRRSLVLGGLLLAAIGFTGCSVAPTKSGTAPSSGSSGSSSGATTDFSPSTSSLSFGSVSDGKSKTSSVTVTNTSTTDSLTVTAITVSGTGFSLSGGPTLPVVVAAGQSLSLVVSFSPKAGGAVNGTLALVSDAAQATVDVALSGEGLSPGQLAVSPTALNFGSQAVDSSQSQTGTLTAGNASITVSTIDQSGQGYSVSGISFPLTLAAGQSVNFTVGFDPQTAGSSIGSISFVSNASNTPSLTLTGTGTQTSSSSHSVSLAWEASTSSVIGYNLYRGTQSGGPYSKLTPSPQAGTSYVDSSVADSTTYYYVATAVNSSNVESTYSNQTSATIP
jgi:hypothetical protein